ncbi:AraC family transcriptional regulator [Pedobacter sp. L105]|uniref:helix-turn-helix domain-containing protein n=1 Tax=Pedobacter sp. L105 TaxID=1641871 RepID=UPI00131CED2B|nr:AraC family transcriptional regulator [Pedobacter sp. L105]
MQQSKIPRLEIETFEQNNFQVPLLKVEPYLPDATYFSIKNRETYPANDYISPNRRKFYKIMHVTKGTGTLTIGLHQYLLEPGMIAFIHPDEIISWQSTETQGQGGHFCLMHPNYFEDTAHILNLFRNYPYFQPSKAVIQLDPDQSSRIDHHFRLILEEDQSLHKDKKDAIFLQLQLVLLEAQRAGKNLTDIAVPESYRYIHGFLALLESAFQIQSPSEIVKIKTAAEFAGQLNVHPNYLNALVKNHTGKTLREHIQERLMYEAKVLLKHTDWDIQAISSSLGFSEQANFAAFFHRNEKSSPSLFRNSSVSMVHL